MNRQSSRTLDYFLWRDTARAYSVVVAGLFVLMNAPGCSSGNDAGDPTPNPTNDTVAIQGNDAVPTRGNEPDTSSGLDVLTIDSVPEPTWTDACSEPAGVDESLLTQLRPGSGPQVFDDATGDSGTGHTHLLNDIDCYTDGVMGGGVAMEDFDLDGDLDLIVTGGKAGLRYYINKGDGRFLDCSDMGGIGGLDVWSNGLSVADYDNDGDRDILLLNLGPNVLLNNLGNGQFADVTKDAGIGMNRRSSGASWADLDGDGLLDLLVANYVQPPGSSCDVKPHFYPDDSELYRQTSIGVFENVNEEVGNSGMPAGASFIAPLIDLNADGRVDIFLTQDFGDSVLATQIYANEGPGEDGEWIRWKNRTEGANIQLAKNIMGVAFFDFEHDGLPEVYLTDLYNGPEDPPTEHLHDNLGDFVFSNITPEFGANGFSYSPEELVRTASWGAISLDFDNDGDEDLYTVYGALLNLTGPELSCEHVLACPQQPNALFENQGNAHFVIRDGTGAEEVGVGRGVAAGDLNGDGCLDLYLVNHNSPSRLLLNRCEGSKRSIRLKLVGVTSNRDAIGAVVTIESGDLTQTKYVLSGAMSVHSALPLALHFGMGSQDVADRISVVWPTGVQDDFYDIALNDGGYTHLEIYEDLGLTHGRRL